jgi:hypothetical protein
VRRCSKEFLSPDDGARRAPLQGRGSDHDDTPAQRRGSEHVEGRCREARKPDRAEHDLAGAEHEHDGNRAQPRDHVVEEQQLRAGRGGGDRAESEQDREVCDVRRRGRDTQCLGTGEHTAANRTEPPSAGAPMQDGTGDGGLPHRNSSRTLAAKRS